jgi:uncharacterized protein YbaR (Trm112 family)
MTDQEFLESLRCPLNPSVLLRVDANHLECERCALKFFIRDGFPVMVVEEAALPPGCESIGQLACQRDQKQSAEKVEAK